jgi:Rad3-related DNA helicase
MSGFDLSQYTPAELGLPEKFDQFRPCQVEAVEWAADQERRRFVGLGLPPGSGKSLIAAALAKVTGMRTAVLTATKALQEQYAADFLDLVDIRGKANYRCADKANVSCRFGAHEGCRLAGGLGCGYEEARARARKAQVVVTNYAYWIRANAFGRGLEPDPKEGGEPRPVELLVLDECHAAERELSNALRVVVRESWLRDAGVLDETDPARRRSEDVGEWAKAAKELGAWVKVRFEAAVKELRRRPTSAGREKVYVLEELVEALGAVGKMRGAEWVCEMKQGTKWGRCWEFDCVWPGQWAEGRLFVGRPR